MMKDEFLSVARVMMVVLVLVLFMSQSVAVGASTVDVEGGEGAVLMGLSPGEPYQQVFTDEMAEEVAAWVLASYPELPFASPQIEIHEDGIHCRGDVVVLGVTFEAFGRVAVFQQGGKVNGRIESLDVAGIPMPGFVMDALDEARGLYEAATWDVVVTNVALREGELLIEGIYR